jgi:hypothetical protein
MVAPSRAAIPAAISAMVSNHWKKLQLPSDAFDPDTFDPPAPSNVESEALVRIDPERAAAAYLGGEPSSTPPKRSPTSWSDRFVRASST